MKKRLANNIILNLNSFTYSEITENINNCLFDPTNLKKSDYIDVNKLYELIFNGGMPELIVQKNK